MTTTPRGIRNNNPGNIDYDGTNWNGLDDPPSDGRFCRFVSPAWGIRAMCRVLITYQDKRKANDGSAIDTVREILERWAPPNENNTNAYVRHVREQMGLDVDRDNFVNVRDPDIMRGLVLAIIRHENGQQPYSDDQISEGMTLAGVA